MKKLLLLFCISIYIGLSKAQVVFCPPGAQWNYLFNNIPQWGPNPIYVNDNITYIKDSISGMDTMKLLRHRFYYYDCYNSGGVYKYTLIKQKGDTVFFKNAKTLNNWQILINYACTTGNGWQTSVINYSGVSLGYNFVVDSVKTIIINGFNLKQLYIAGFGTITERMGFAGFMFPFHASQPGCDGLYFSKFICYRDSAFGLKQYYNYGCEFSGVDGINENTSQGKIKIYPNPANETIVIKMEDEQSLTEYKLQITDLTGRKIKSVDKLKEDGISIKDLSSGVYFIQVYDKEVLLSTQKFIKK